MQQGIDKQTIISLARKQYEQSKQLRIPPVIVKLPSKGLVYPESSPLRSGTVEMRHMTAWDEDILTNSSYIDAGIVFDKLLESLVVSEGVDANDIIVADREKLLVTARILGYGSDYPVAVTNPATGTVLTRSINLSKIKNREFNLIADANGEFEYEIKSTGDKLKFRFLTPNLIKKVASNQSVSSLLENIICEINGDRTPATISEYIKYDFNAGESRSFRKYMSDNLPGMDLNIEIEGEDGSTFTTGFQFGPDLFWF